MILYAISDRTMATGDGLPAWAQACFQAGVDWVQIREKDLSGRELLDLSQRSRAASPKGRLLINERIDVSLAADLDGVHLPSDSIGVAEARILLGGALVGVSCHSKDEAIGAASDGADFVVFGPVFDTPSKRPYGPPQGLETLADVCRQADLPVLALGGVNEKNAARCLEAGAAGIAGISLFRPGPDLARSVEALRRLGGNPNGTRGPIPNK